MTKDEAFRKALGELEEILIWTLPPIAGYKLEKATAAIKEALAQPEQEPVAKYDTMELHVTHSIVAGALYDFMGWLTSRRTRICLSDRDNAGPAVDAIVDFSKMRGLMLEDAQVEHWQKVLSEPPQHPAVQGEPVAWMYQCSADSSGPVLMQHKKDWAESGSGLWVETPLYTTPPQRKPLPPMSPCEMTQAEGKMFKLGWLECEAAHGIKE